MKIIWYNPDQQKYKSGKKADLDLELAQSKNQEAYTVLMQLSGKSNSTVRKIIHQLNTLNQIVGWSANPLSRC